MDHILQGIPQVLCILDDIIISGRNDAEHVQNMESVLDRLQKYNLGVHSAKCQFLQEKVEYCGHEIDNHEIHQAEEKVRAIKETPRPQNLTQLLVFISLVNYYRRFLPVIASVLSPLQEAFLEAKELVISDQVLSHHIPERPIPIACDASYFGVEAVLSHTFEDGTERPIAFSSRSLRLREIIHR